MNDDDKQQILKAREYIVSKANTLVQKSRYNLSVPEQRTVAYICSKIKPISTIDRVNDVPFQLEYEFNILEYSRVCGLEGKNGRFYEETKVILKGLHDKSMWLTLDDGSETTVGWLSKAYVNKKSGIVRIIIDEDLAPYLFDLQCKFLSYGLKNILNMKSQYSIRLYELMKSYHDMKVGQIDRRSFVQKNEKPMRISWTINLEELKKTLMVDTIKSYSNFNLFKTKVLEVAQKEINELTDITLYFETITKGRKTVKVKFTIVAKVGMNKFLAETHNDELFKELE